jgi:hypothetical protein
VEISFTGLRFLPLNLLVAIVGYKNTIIILLLVSSKWWEIAALVPYQTSVSLTRQSLPQPTSIATVGEVLFFILWRKSFI